MAGKSQQHGTLTGYIDRRCRCEDCRKKWSEYEKARRLREDVKQKDREHNARGWKRRKERKSTASPEQLLAIRKYDAERAKRYRDKHHDKYRAAVNLRRRNDPLGRIHRPLSEIRSLARSGFPMADRLWELALLRYQLNQEAWKKWRKRQTTA